MQFCRFSAILIANKQFSGLLLGLPVAEMLVGVFVIVKGLKSK